MSKHPKGNKEIKKKPVMTAKEKRNAKRVRKESQGFFGNDTPA